MAIDLSDDDGLVDVILSGGTVVKVDAFQAQERILDFAKRHGDGKPSEEYVLGLIAIADGLGLPKLTHKQAILFQEGVFAACSGLKKSTGGSAASQGSTPESTPPS